LIHHRRKNAPNEKKSLKLKKMQWFFVDSTLREAE